MAKQFVIVRDEPDGRLLYFIRLGLGMFWECSNRSEEAKRYQVRSNAAKMLHKTGKHTQGWRILQAQ